MTVDDRFVKKSRKNDPVATYYFPNGEVFRPRHTPKRRGKPDIPGPSQPVYTFPRSNSMVSLPSSAYMTRLSSTRNLKSRTKSDLEQSIRSSKLDTLSNIDIQNFRPSGHAPTGSQSYVPSVAGSPSMGSPKIPGTPPLPPPDLAFSPKPHLRLLSLSNNRYAENASNIVKLEHSLYNELKPDLKLLDSKNSSLSSYNLNRSNLTTPQTSVNTFETPADTESPSPPSDEALGAITESSVPISAPAARPQVSQLTSNSNLSTICKSPKQDRLLPIQSPSLRLALFASARASLDDEPKMDISEALSSEVLPLKSEPASVQSSPASSAALSELPDPTVSLSPLPAAAEAESPPPIEPTDRPARHVPPPLDLTKNTSPEPPSPSDFSFCAGEDVLATKRASALGKPALPFGSGSKHSLARLDTTVQQTSPAQDGFMENYVDELIEEYSQEEEPEPLEVLPEVGVPAEYKPNGASERPKKSALSPSTENVLQPHGFLQNRLSMLNIVDVDFDKSLPGTPETMRFTVNTPDASPELKHLASPPKQTKPTMTKSKSMAQIKKFLGLKPVKEEKGLGKLKKKLLKPSLPENASTDSSTASITSLKKPKKSFFKSIINPSISKEPETPTHVYNVRPKTPSPIIETFAQSNRESRHYHLPQLDVGSDDGFSDLLTQFDEMEKKLEIEAENVRSKNRTMDIFMKDDELTKAQIADQQRKDHQLSDESLPRRFDLDDKLDAEDEIEEAAKEGYLQFTTNEDGSQCVRLDKTQLNNMLESGLGFRYPNYIKHVRQMRDMDLVEIVVDAFRPGLELPREVNHDVSLILKKSQDHKTEKGVKFSGKVSISETWAPYMYRRYNKSVTQYYLSGHSEVNRIKNELNAYKCHEMLVHEKSQNNTHFFY